MILIFPHHTLFQYAHLGPWLFGIQLILIALKVLLVLTEAGKTEHKYAQVKTQQM